MTDVPRDPRDIQALVEQAKAAFVRDASYAVDMAKAAVSIRRRQAAWNARHVLKDAERNALQACRARPWFVCRATSPCGVGDCPFAAPALAVLEVGPAEGRSRRPQPSEFPSYDLEVAVRALAG